MYLKMIKLWTMKKIDLSLASLFKLELNCKSYKEKEYIFLEQYFLFLYYQLKS